MPTLEITTMIGCPILCSFCPQDKLVKNYTGDKYLSLKNYQLMLSKIPKNVRIDFSGMSEPWANKECTDMLEHTLENGYEVAIYSTLYGMNKEIAERVHSLLLKFAKSIRVICIHLQDNNKNMKGLKIDDEWIFALNNFIDLYNKKIIVDFQFITMDSEKKLDPLLVSLNDFLINFNAHDRAGSLNNNQVLDQNINIVKNIKGAIKCSFTDKYDQNVLLPDGSVLLCCMDYGKKHVIGNLLKQNYNEIYNSNSMNKLILSNSKSSCTESICRNCERAVAA